MLTNVTPEDWAQMSERQQDDYRAARERPYTAVNGHRLVPYPQYVGGRPVYSSAYTTCTDDCPACKDGDRLDNYEPWDED